LPIGYAGALWVSDCLAGVDMHSLCIYGMRGSDMAPMGRLDILPLVDRVEWRYETRSVLTVIAHFDFNSGNIGHRTCSSSRLSYYFSMQMMLF
jgi:hypothetical protein